MRRILFVLTSIALVVACRKEPAKAPKVFPSDGYAQVSFIGRSFEVINVLRTTVTTPSSEEKFIQINGVLDHKDSLALVIPAPHDSIAPITLFLDSIGVGFLFEGDMIYGAFRINNKDSYIDSISIDSLNTSYRYYSVQFNMKSDFENQKPDSLWFQGRIFLKND